MNAGASMLPAGAAPPIWRNPAAWALIADLLAVMIAVALPWSTSLVAIYATAWFVVAAPMFEFSTLVRSLKRPACFLPIAFFGLAVVGTLWSIAPLGERIHALGPVFKLLMVPLLMHHFGRSKRGLWVFVGFLVSCTLLMAMSWMVAFDPRMALKSEAEYGVPVKNYIDQSQSFGLCAVALAYPVIGFLRERKFLPAMILAVIAASLLANMAFVVVSRTALIAIPVMIMVFAFVHLGTRGRIVALCAIAALAGAAWLASPRLQTTIGSIFSQYNQYERINNVSSVDLRLEFWRKSLGFFAESPLLGHGTGSTRELFEQSAVGRKGAAAVVIGNPHNQTLNAAVQWGMVGVAVLYAMWWVHLMLFRGDDLASWIGLLVIVQNVVGSLFNSHLSDFHEGWMYVLGVGVAGGMAMRARTAISVAAPAFSTKP
jgi:O-antigen ligase